jgi:hypothetical protein
MLSFIARTGFKMWRPLVRGLSILKDVSLQQRNFLTPIVLSKFYLRSNCQKYGSSNRFQLINPDKIIHWFNIS